MNTLGMGVKLLVICVLALVMTIPSFFVNGLVEDRAKRGSDVQKEISSHVGGPQIFLGPTLVVPYSVSAQARSESAKSTTYLIFPAQGYADLETTTTERHRSLFKVPVFQVDLKFDATFDLRAAPANALQGATLDWNRAEIVVGASDARGALADITLTTDKRTVTLSPDGSDSPISVRLNENEQSKLVLFGAQASDIAKPGTSFHVTSKLRFSGAEQIAVLAYGQTTHLSAKGDWRNPGFYGSILPIRRSVTNTGFVAEWSVPSIARGVRAEGPSDSVTGLGDTALGVSFIEVADPYQSVTRSLKYLLLFLGWIFLSYFLFEVTSGKRVHLAQYILVGIAQIIFYLLLLSIAERIGFDFGFLVAALPTVALLSANAGWIFSSRLQFLRASVLFGVLYALIYLLLRLEDYALLAGSIASFLAVAAAMYLTQKINWHSPVSSTGRTQETGLNI